MSKRVTWLGGGSTMRPGRSGNLEFESSDDAASTLHSAKNAKTAFERAGTEKKLIRSFISQCATAYAAGKLDASTPKPPKALFLPIRKAGGNIAWLSAQPRFQSLFHKDYCRVIGQDVPLEKVWAQPKRRSP